MEIPKDRLKLVKNPTSFDLIIPEDVEVKIRHLCNRVHNIEWSGTLFYKVEGSLDDGTFKATCLDICVMDIGTVGYTEFKDTPDIINYRVEHGLLQQGIYEGLIHSHHSMKAYFSGTDTNTLIDEGSDLNHFLSLIVNNDGQYVARITRKLKKKTKTESFITYTESSEYNTYEDTTIIVSKDAQRQETKIEEQETTVIEYFEGIINKTEVHEPFTELDARLEEIKNNKSKKVYNELNPLYKESNIPNPIVDDRQRTLNFTNQVEDDDILEDVEFYCTEKVPFNITRTLCAQLLTGSILITKTNLDLNDWVKKMDKLYENRFGSFDDSWNEFRLQNWIQMLLDAIIGDTVDSKYEDSLAVKYHLDNYNYNDSDAFIRLYACAMIDYLKSLPISYVKNMMIEGLTELMPKNYDKFRCNK